ncbi:uncharacterized protein LOC113141324 [Mastacembelus armatus]|uniref:uncharacterized protein LOC113141324 n=1 Tax=Mastacembelus armatus TaxID=205130 RepID=UPI000E45A8FE|nr:uncharacterized protein LOC113141324 [Mastacembelus armatus]
MSGSVTVCSIILFLALTSVSGVQRLNSINDLKRINFDQSVAKHSLLLLHWFANTVHIDNNNNIWLTFDPYNRDFGSHHYRNREELLEPLLQGNPRHQYYTLGNLNQASSMQFPYYVTNPESEYEGRNKDRIIIRIIDPNSGRQRQRIDRVYITRHYNTSYGNSAYDGEHTYEITTNLLREIRQFAVEDNQVSLTNLTRRFGSNATQFQLNSIRNTWGNLACLGLLLFIVIQERRHNSSQFYNKPQHEVRSYTSAFVVPPQNRQPQWDVDASQTCNAVTQSAVLDIPEDTQTHWDARGSETCCEACTPCICTAFFFIFIIILCLFIC